MGTAFAWAVLFVCVLSLVPVSVRLMVRWDAAASPPWGLSLRLWGVDLLGLSQRGSRRAAPRSQSKRAGPLVPPWVRKWGRWAWRRWRRRDRRTGSVRTGRGRTSSLLLRFLRGIFVLPTRRVQLDLGGIDPAALGMLHGLFLSVEPLLPHDGLLRFRPRWGLVHPHARLVWHLRFSLAGLIGGIVRRRRRAPPPLLPSVP